MSIYVLPADLPDCSLQEHVVSDDKHIAGMVVPF